VLDLAERSHQYCTTLCGLDSLPQHQMGLPRVHEQLPRSTDRALFRRSRPPARVE
jgi:hypothetical protein